MKKIFCIALVLIFTLGFCLQSVALAGDVESLESSIEVSEEIVLEEAPVVEEAPVAEEIIVDDKEQLDSADTELQESEAKPDIDMEHQYINAYENALSGNFSEVAAKLPAPRNFSVNLLDKNTLSLMWSSVYGAEMYSIYRWTDTEQGDIIGYVKGNEISYIDRGLRAGVTYYYMMAAHDAYGNMGTISDLDWNIPRNPVRSPLNVRASSAGYDSVKLTWATVSDAAKYVVFGGTDPSNMSALEILSPNTTTSYVHRDLKINTKYYYQVYSLDNLDDLGTRAQTVSATPKVPRTSNPKATAYMGNKIKITWNKSSGASGYYVYRSTTRLKKYSVVKTVSASSTSYMDSKLTTGKTYFYKVVPYRTVDGVKHKGAMSNIVSAKATSGTPDTPDTPDTPGTPDIPEPPKAPLEPPINVSAVFSTLNSIDVLWNMVDSATGYVIYRADSANGTFHEIHEVTNTFHIDRNGISSTNTYYYKVRAYRTINGEREFGAFSYVAVATPKQTEKPTYSIGAPSTTNNNATYSIFSMTNKGTQDFIIMANSGRLVRDLEYSSSYDRSVTMWVNGVKATDKIIVRPGQQVRVQTMFSPVTVYTSESYTIFDFIYDGKVYRNESSSKYGSSFHSIY